MLTSSRLAGICVFLFVVSALVSTSLRTHHDTVHWPCLTSSCRAKKQAVSRFAFATFLAGSPSSTPDETLALNNQQLNLTDLEIDEQDQKDGYYQGARVLAYQLLHAPETRGNGSVPFLIIVTTDVSPHKRARLAADGATVVLVDKLNAEWVHPGAERWRDVLTKLRLFQLTEYEKLCFIDADMLVTGPLDGVFDDPATDVLRTKREPTQVRDDEALLPPTYMFAGKPDLFSYEHDIPPGPSNYLNSGFFVFRPSIPLFEYYISLLQIPDRFDPRFPEQNLLNYAHRPEGNMPWARLGWRWNMNWPTLRDYEAGARSFHAKYWDGDTTHDPVLKEKWWRQWAEMRGFYRGLDAGREQK